MREVRLQRKSKAKDRRSQQFVRCRRLVNGCLGGGAEEGLPAFAVCRSSLRATPSSRPANHATEKLLELELEIQLLARIKGADCLDGALLFTLFGPDLEVIDHAYGARLKTKALAPGAKSALPLSFAESHGWYDFSVRVKEFQPFEKRYAGRIETGLDSISDPHMGRVI